MVQMNPHQVAKLVQDKLNHAAHGAAIRVRVLTDQVRLGSEVDGWWYVPVSYEIEPGKLYTYYEVFAQIEEELEEAEHVNVLLVPRIEHGIEGKAH
jgi:hypothetical protein